MKEYDKLEWIHSQLQEIQNGNFADIETMLKFVEDIRENYFNKISIFNGDLVLKKSLTE
jgi:hypothetical protein|tara:strand:- start:1250 stop:1426 length:177 start_codon:yes stop_codon:yes gene_type:complete